MLRKMVGILLLACTLAATVMFGTGAAAAADEAGRPVPAAAIDAGVQSSPKCSGTESYGPIRYQVCVKYNCDSTGCYHRGYLGVKNTATSARTVTWDLNWSLIGAPWRDDDHDVVALAAGQQKTIESRYSYHTSPCNFTGQRMLTVAYSSGTSAPIQVEDFMACV